MSEHWKAGAVIVAAGESRRMNGLDKILAPLGGRPLLARVVDVFQKSDRINGIVIVLNRQNLEAGQKLVAGQGWS